jgi:hypothetical protein
MALVITEPNAYKFVLTHAAINQYLKKVRLLHHLATRNFTELFTRYQYLPEEVKVNSIMLANELGGTEGNIEGTMWEPFLRRLGSELEDAESAFEKGEWDEAVWLSGTVEELVVPVRGIVREMDGVLKRLEERAKANKVGTVPALIVTVNEPRQVLGRRRREGSPDMHETEVPSPTRRKREVDDSGTRRESARLAASQRGAESRASSRPPARRGEVDLTAGRRVENVPGRGRSDNRTPAGRRNDRESLESGGRSPAPRRRQGR